MRKILSVAVLAVSIALMAVSAASAGGRCPPQPEPQPPAAQAPRCPAGLYPYGGKDGDESEPYHNQECCPDADSNQKCDDVVRPGQTEPNRVQFWGIRLR